MVFTFLLILGAPRAGPEAYRGWGSMGCRRMVRNFCGALRRGSLM
jgi:hypothetical protein